MYSAARQTTLRYDIPVVLVNITKLNSRRLKFKTQLSYIYMANDGNL